MAAGQFLGQRGSFIYTSDTGEQYIIEMDATIGAITELGLVAANQTNAGTLTSPPKRLTLRYVNWTGICDGRAVAKRLVANASGVAYSSGSSTPLDIGGSSDGRVTGRVGEKFTFSNLPSAPTGGTP